MPEKIPEKKNSDSMIGNILNSCAKELLSFAMSFIEKKLKRYIAAAIIFMASFVVILYGIGLLVGSLLPQLMPGASHILVGIAAILIWLAYEKYR
ncbi:MAG: hypothetical protein WA139_04125 [Candidatus Aenigmatarchaeota archaeon]